jgi:hypothetical protein
MTAPGTFQQVALCQNAQRTWIFQANPSKYDIFHSLASEREELWNLNQHAREVNVGDRILIWISGQDAGIYAVGTVLTPAVTRSDSGTGIGYWHTKKDGLQPKQRVLVRYDTVFLDRPLTRDYLRADPELWDLSILRSPRGTNFSVSDAEWDAIRLWLEDGLE